MEVGAVNDWDGGGVSDSDGALPSAGWVGIGSSPFKLSLGLLGTLIGMLCPIKPLASTARAKNI